MLTCTPVFDRDEQGIALIPKKVYSFIGEKTVN